MADITKIALAENELSDVDRLVVFEYFSRRLVDHLNIAISYAKYEFKCSKQSRTANEQMRQVTKWAEEMLKHAWAACDKPSSSGLNQLLFPMMI